MLEYILYIGVLIIYLLAGIIICAAVQCFMGETFEYSYDLPPLGIGICFWPILVIAIIIYGFMFLGNNIFERSVNAITGMCTKIKQKIQDRMRED